MLERFSRWSRRVVAAVLVAASGLKLLDVSASAWLLREAVGMTADPVAAFVPMIMGLAAIELVAAAALLWWKCSRLASCCVAVGCLAYVVWVITKCDAGLLRRTCPCFGALQSGRSSCAFEIARSGALGAVAALGAMGRASSNPTPGEAATGP